MNPIAARLDSEATRSLCAQLAPGTEPMTLQVRPAPHAQARACFDAVSQHMAERGGSVCHGWQVWEWPGVLLEAEFHAVWRDPDGVLHDITPKAVPRPAITFVADPVRRFEGRRIPNVYRPLCDSPAVTGFIRACEEEFELLTRGDRAFLRNVVLPAWEALALGEIRKRKLEFARTLGLAP